MFNSQQSLYITQNHMIIV